MKTIDKDACRLIRERINAELQKLAAELDLNICATNARFTSTNATFKLEISTKGENGAVVTKEAQAYKTLYQLYSLPADGLGKQVKFGGQDFVITGLNPRCEKYPLTATSNGRGYKLPLSALGGRIDFGATV